MARPRRAARRCNRPFGEPTARSSTAPRRLAGGLRAGGARDGDVLALVASNGIGFPIVAHGALLAGLTLAPAGPLLTARELSAFLRQTGARYAVADAARCPRSARRRPLREPRRCSRSTRSRSPTDPARRRRPRRDRAPAQHERDQRPTQERHPTRTPVRWRRCASTPRSPLRASGPTTWSRDRPLRAHVRLGDAQLGAARRRAHGDARPLRARGLPAHDRGPSRQRRRRRAADRARAGPASAVDRYDLSSLRLLVVGAAPCPAEIERECEARLGCVVGQGLGMTEAGPIALPEDPACHGSVGRLVARTQAVIVDPETVRGWGRAGRGSCGSAGRS